MRRFAFIRPLQVVQTLLVVEAEASMLRFRGNFELANIEQHPSETTPPVDGIAAFGSICFRYQI